jgi:K+-sensing histidine kinase KdpD
MMQSRSWGLSARAARTDTWLLAIGCVAVAFGIQLVLGSITADAPLLLFFGAIIISAWLGGFRAGVVATVLSAAIADIDVRTLQWNGEFSFPWALRLLLFIGEGVFISAAAQGRSVQAAKEPVVASVRSQGSAGDASSQTRPVRISAVVREVIATSYDEAAAKNVYLETVIDHGTGAIEGDRERLREVVETLVSNAIKFTPPSGRVCVRVRRRRHDVELSVVDTGRGIADQDLAQIFLPCDGNSGSRLARARQQVHLHGGEMSVYSAGPGTGATFTVRLRRLMFAPAARESRQQLAV